MKRRSILYGVGRSNYQRLEGALRYAHEHDWNLCVDIALTWSVPLRWNGDGIVALLDETNPITEYLLNRPEPKVMLEWDMPDIEGPRVVNDNMTAGIMAADHFLERGFHNFAFLRLHDMYFNAAQIRGYRSRLVEEGRKVTVHAFSEAKQHRNDAVSWLRTVLRKLPKPVAIFAADDVLAVDIVHIAKEIGLRIPEDVAVLGTPNIREIVENSPVPVSSVDMNEDELVYQACALLDKMLDGAEMPSKPVLVAPRGVMVRASTDTTAFSEPIVQSAMSFIRDHYSEAIGVEEIAEGVGVDRRRLCQIFRNVTGSTPHEALCAQRLQRVQALLIGSDWSLPKIAKATGFSTHQYLCRFFLKATGLTPTEYRKQ